MGGSVSNPTGGSAIDCWWISRKIDDSRPPGSCPNFDEQRGKPVAVTNGPNSNARGGGGGNGGDGKSLVLAHTDIVELVGQTVSLKRRGRDYVGLCPFHQEKTPSFHVKPDRQYFYCFGCKENGNAIDFVMKRDRVEFKEALLTLAQRAGLELPRLGGGSAGSKEK